MICLQVGLEGGREIEHDPDLHPGKSGEGRVKLFHLEFAYSYVMFKHEIEHKATEGFSILKTFRPFIPFLAT